MTKRKIKAFYISHYIILAFTVLIDFINPKIPNWLYKEYNPFDMFLWKYEMVSAFFVLPFFFFAMIYILVTNRENIKKSEIAIIGISFPLDIFIGIYTIALYTARF
jgi:uncharacterized BrkB/YihY/UPF0761 family membrane protein